MLLISLDHHRIILKIFDKFFEFGILTCIQSFSNPIWNIIPNIFYRLFSSLRMTYEAWRCCPAEFGCRPSRRVDETLEAFIPLP